MSALPADATTALLRALRASFAGTSIAFEEIRSRSWASATFTGARHEVVLVIRGADAEAQAAVFADTLDVAEFTLRGHIMADISLVSREAGSGPTGLPQVRLRIEALTVEAF